MAQLQHADANFLKFYNTIAGTQRSSSNIHHGVNPADKTLLWDVPNASEADLDEAVRAAREAFKTWSRTTWSKRQAVLKKMAEVLLDHKDNVARILVAEGGKPKSLAEMEVNASANALKYHASMAEPTIEIIEDTEQLKLIQYWVPLGVAGAICPWNFPLVLSTQKIAAALLAGNSVILKPSPFTPYSSLKFVELVNEFLPSGVLQALNGGDFLGPAMTKHEGIDKISFTGSIATGKRVMASAATTLKRVTLELGGNSACVVCPDVDVTKVAPMVAASAFFNAGQLCVASKRLYVHESIYEDFKAAIVAVVQSWKLSGAEGQWDMGPVQNEMQYGIVRSFFEDCAANGYRFALGGEMGDGKGFVVQPCIVDNPPDNSKIVREEPFGPIVPLQPWTTEEDLLPRVNNTRTGLSASVYSADLERATRIARQIEAGSVWINGLERPLPQAHFAGHKESGMGGELGTHGLLSYMLPQVLHVTKVDVGKSVA